MTGIWCQGRFYMTRKLEEIDNRILVRILKQMEAKGIRQRDMALHLGITNSSLTQWKSGRTRSYMNYIDEIANYLGVEKEYLLHGNDNGYESVTSFTQKELSLIFGIRTLPREQTELFYDAAFAFLEACRTNGK